MVAPLFALHALQTAHARLWSFAVPIVFAALNGAETSLGPLAAFTSAVQLLKLLVLPFLGGLADSLPLPRVATASVLGHFTVVLGCLVLLASFHGGGTLTPLAATLVVLCGAASELLKDFSSIALEMRVAPSSVQNSKSLVGLNSRVKQAELTAKVIVPLVFGWYASLAQTPTHLICVVLCAHLVSACAAFSLWRRTLAASGMEKASVKAQAKRHMQGWSFRALWDPVTGMCFAYALLFCSVLSDHDPLFTLHLAAAGLEPGILGSARSAGAFAGLLGTFLWPYIQSRMGTPRGAAIALLAFIVVVGAALPGLRMSPGVALMFVTLSRPFLWTFDLAMVSILQDFVPVHWRGKAAALQAVACELFELLIAAAAIALPNSEQFWALAGISFAAVCTSGIIFGPCALLVESPSKDSIPVHEYAA